MTIHEITPEYVKALIEKMLDLVGDKTSIDVTFKKGHYCFRKFERTDEMVIGWKSDKLLFHYEPFRKQDRSPYRVMDEPETWLPFVHDTIQRAEKLKGDNK